MLGPFQIQLLTVAALTPDPIMEPKAQHLEATPLFLPSCSQILFYSVPSFEDFSFLD